MAEYSTIALFIGGFLAIVAVLIAIIYVLVTQEQNNTITSFVTSSPFLVQFTSSQEYIATPVTANKKLSTTDNQQNALRFFASRNPNGAALLVSFVANNAGNFLTQRQSSGTSTDEVWYLDVDGQESGSRVECNFYDLDTGEGKEWTQANSWQLTSDGFLGIIREQGSNLYLSSTADGVEATNKLSANEVRLVVPDEENLDSSGVFFSTTPYRIRISSQYVVEKNGSLTLGNKQDALTFKSFRTSSGTLVCRCYPDNNFEIINTQQDEQIQYLAATPSGPLLKDLKNNTVESTTLWTTDGNTLTTQNKTRYLSMDSGSIALASSKNNAATVTIEPVEQLVLTQ